MRSLRLAFLLHPKTDETRAEGQVNDAGPRFIILAAATAVLGDDSSLPGYPLVGPPCHLAYVEIIADFSDLLKALKTPYVSSEQPLFRSHVCIVTLIRRQLGSYTRTRKTSLSRNRSSGTANLSLGKSGLVSPQPPESTAQTPTVFSAAQPPP